MKKICREIFWNFKVESWGSRLNAGTDTCYCAEVVCALNVQSFLESSFKLVEVIGHIRNEICVSSVSLLYDTVLIIAEICGFKPQCAVFLVKFSGFIDGCNSVLNSSVSI